jgi:uncharacterized protein (DUF302 family)
MTPAATPIPVHGIVRLRSAHSVAETAQRLIALVHARQLILFADIDFAADAQRAGLAMRPMRKLIFGNPKAGTPLLVAAPTAGLDLPLEALIWEDPSGAAWLGYNDADYVGDRHELPASLLPNLAALPTLVSAAIGPATIP